MLKVTVPQANFDRLKGVVNELALNIRREMGAAINKVAKKVAFESSKELGKVLSVKPKKLLKKVVNTGKRATSDYPFATIYLNQGYPYPLKYFGAKQTKKGVRYKIDPRLKAKSTLLDAFIVPQYGGNVFMRASKEKRYPLRKIYGPAPGDVYEATQLPQKMAAVAEVQLKKQIDERIRFLTLKAQGKLKRS